MSTSEWKQVPPELIHGICNIWTTATGKVRIGDKEVSRRDGPKGKHGRYSILGGIRPTLYFHRLVYFAHSGKSVDELQRGRIVFKNVEDPKTIVDEEGYYRCWVEDMLFEKSAFNVKESDIPDESSDTHLYGEIVFGKWHPLYTFNKEMKDTKYKSNIYEICFLKNSENPCIVKNTNRNTVVKYHFHNGHDAYINLKQNDDTSINFNLTHIMLASAFPTVPILETVDHIDDNSKNNLIMNLRWLSRSENSKKGQKIQTQVRAKKEHPDSLPDELWKALPISDYTLKHYMVSNRGRVKREKYGFLSGSQLRGKKYTYFTVTTEPGKQEKYYAHQLVYRTFHGELTDGQIILHNDMAPLTENGAYRNWAEDLRSGSKSDNNREYHAAKRCITLV